MKLLLAISLTACLAGAAPSAVPTFNHDIAPILYENCAACHRPGQVAPFALLTYQDAAKRAALIAAVTAKRYMPPWKAEPGYGNFKDERRLTEGQIALIQQWAQHGAPEGRAADKPAPPQFASGWQAGKPDAVYTATEPFSIPADGPDLYRCFVVPLNLTTDRYVKTVEFHPGDPRVVHHALFYLDTSGEARKLDDAAPGPGYPCFGGPQIAPSGSLGGWAPGANPAPVPEGAAHFVPKDADLVMQIHYHPSGKPETDQSSMGLMFTEKPTKGLAGMELGTYLINIPAGDANHVVTDWILVPEDAELTGITPHAHLLCTDMKVNARLPGGKMEPLIWIKDWDFNWQGQYRYAEPVKLPKGTRVEMRFVYDNSAANVHNPSNPPRRVSFGEQTTDEMALVFLQLVLPHPGDVPAFRRAVILSRLDQFLTEGGMPAGLRSFSRLREGERVFDRNHDGKLDDQERAAYLRYLAARLQ
ncbi:MAG TPA: hypothetical protein VG675_24310 [Bryobacteraceae bacterium]|nr:hypothetical protein [Bryobacteraceae bacterium]